ELPDVLRIRGILVGRRVVVKRQPITGPGWIVVRDGRRVRLREDGGLSETTAGRIQDDDLERAKSIRDEGDLGAIRTVRRLELGLAIKNTRIAFETDLVTRARKLIDAARMGGLVEVDVHRPEVDGAAELVGIIRDLGVVRVPGRMAVVLAACAVGDQDRGAELVAVLASRQGVTPDCELLNIDAC